MLNAPAAPWPSFTQEEADAVSRVLISNKVNYWTGTQGRDFETEFAAFAGTEHAIALANGTVALDLALHGLRIGDRNGGKATDQVIVTPRSFMASASAVVNAGAVPVFADVCPDSGNITPGTVAPLIGPETRAILCVHLAGWPCDMAGLRDLAAPRGIRLIEDCAQAHGAHHRGRPVGGLGDVAAWSFCQDKIMTTGGEGGMVTCNDPDLWRRMWAFKDHGKSWEAVYERQHKPGFRWLHESIGTNWRMTEMQSAIGRIQLGRMPGWHAARTRNAQLLADALAPFAGEGGPVRVPLPPCPGCRCAAGAGCTHAFYRFYAYVRPENLGPGWNRDRIAAEITGRGVTCMQGSCSEIYREKAFDGTGWRPAAPLPHAQALGETSLMFLVHPTITPAQAAEAASVAASVVAASGAGGF